MVRKHIDINDSGEYLNKIKSKNALFLGVLGFFTIELLPIYGTIPGLLLCVYSIYLSMSLKNNLYVDDLVRISYFFSISGIAFLFSVSLYFGYKILVSY